MITNSLLEELSSFGRKEVGLAPICRVVTDYQLSYTDDGNKRKLELYIVGVPFNMHGYPDQNAKIDIRASNTLDPTLSIDAYKQLVLNMAEACRRVLLKHQINYLNQQNASSTPIENIPTIVVQSKEVNS